MKHLIVISGPTASGKTSISVKLAKHYGCEILSADSRQFFKELNIGTAKPTIEEMDGIAHHFVGNLSISQDYTAGKFEKDALHKLDELFQKNDVAVLVGGSGLYIDAVCNGFDDVPGNKAVRNLLQEQFEKEGIKFLQLELQKNDPEYYNSVDQNNPQRLMRSVEVFRTSGKPFSSFLTQNTTKRNFNCIKIALDWERELLYNRINLRVDQMIKSGLENEVNSLILYREKTALKTVGYSEFFEFFDGKISKEEAIELIKRNSRRYAKRQITWFKRDKDTSWMRPNNLANIIKYIDGRLNLTT
ncbi:MAG: tRNA (adenosine(37)-N6)-dimethylallyltransferase MiaA [Flavobacteriales bacterium]|nr:tRNA (adenosine(37)-N6)-dimethylallyltransferase MiaA [Flavobacteriales bacterium]